MSLPSQTVRSGRNRRMMSNVVGRRRGDFPWGIVIIGAIVLAAVVAFAFWRGWIGGGLVKQAAGPAPAQANTTVPARVAAATPAPSPSPVQSHTPTPTPTPTPVAVPAAVPSQSPSPKSAVASAPATVPAPATAAPASQSTTPPTPAELTAKVNAAVGMIGRDPVAARRELTASIDTRALSGPTLAEALRGIELANSQLLFAPVVVAADPMQASYTIKPGDSLAKIARAAGMKADWRLIQRLNKIKDPGKISVGQKLKVPLGTFHAVVHREAFRMDVYQDHGGDRVIVATFPVGLGERNGTPSGMFKVRANSKLVDPEWRNPRTGEYFSSGDPKNPIGDHWIGLAGAEESTKNFLGYGIHGTVEPESIGQNASMGCVRMNAADVALVYELLTEDGSTIEIRPN